MLKFALIYTKRIFRNPSFIVLLLMMPVAAYLFSLAASSDASIMKAGIVYSDNDSLSVITVNSINSSESIIKFSEITDRNTAEEMVSSGKLDCAFIFDEKMTEIIAGDVTDGKTNNYMTVIAREDTSKIKLAALKMVTTLYPETVKILYNDTVNKELNITEEEKNISLDNQINIYKDNNILQFIYIGDLEDDAATTNTISDEKKSILPEYILAPLKGMLACLIILLGLAANLYYFSDERKGILSLYNVRKRFVISQIYIFVPVLLGAVVAYITMFAFRIIKSPLMEALNILLYIVAVSGFASILKVLTKRIEIMGVVIPVIMISVLFSSPIFVNLKGLRTLSYIFPVSHYLLAEGVRRYSIIMLVYGTVLILCAYIIYNIQNN